MQLHVTYFNSLNFIKLFFLLIIIFTLSSCYNVNVNEVAVPEKMLSQKQMVDIITDIQLIEAGFSINKYVIKGKDLKPEYYNEIFKKHSITVQQFSQNIDYYYASPKVMEEIYESVLANLSKIQSKVIIEKEELDKQLAADSIAAVNDSLEIIKADSIKRIQ